MGDNWTPNYGISQWHQGLVVYLLTKIWVSFPPPPVMANTPPSPPALTSLLGPKAFFYTCIAYGASMGLPEATVRYFIELCHAA